MPLRILIATLVATLFAFAWGAFAWSTNLYGGWAFRALPQGEAFAAHMGATLAEDGAYVFPHMPDTTGMTEQQAAIATAAADAQFEAGAHIMVLMRHQPASSGTDLTLVKGFLLEFFTSAVVAAVIAIAAKFGARLQDRIAIAFGLAVFAVCASPILHWNFFHLPDNYALAIGIDTFVPWLLAGIACALIIRPAARGEKVA